MKKILCLLLVMAMADNASAQTVVIINNSDSQPVYTAPVTVVNQAPYANNNYYKERGVSSSGAAITAGITTAVIGAVLFDGLRHHKSKHHVAAIPRKHVPIPLPPRGHFAYGGKAGIGHSRRL